MIISKVKIKTAPLFLLVYFLFAQVYPYVHIHVFSQEENQHIEFTFHPVDGCHFEHDGAETHHHDCNHIHSVLDHTVQKIEYKNPIIFGEIVFGQHRPVMPHQEKLQSCANPFPRLQQYFNTFALRGPPSIC